MSDSSGLRLALTATHLWLVFVGIVNLLVVFIVVANKELRTVTNIYMVSLCVADFLYLFDLCFVAATSLNGKSWPFGNFLCHFYHGSEAVGKYGSVIFVVLLAVDRYCAMCKPDYCQRNRKVSYALWLSLIAWLLAIVFALPLFIFSGQIVIPDYPWRPTNGSLPPTKSTTEGRFLCSVYWPSPKLVIGYISLSSFILFIFPVFIIGWSYYKVFCKLQEATKGSRRLNRNETKRPYARVTKSVQRVVLFHLACWTPFWMFNLYTTITRRRMGSQVERIVINIIHLFPYVNCALNPILYAYRAESFRKVFRRYFTNEKLSDTTRKESAVSGFSKKFRGTRGGGGGAHGHTVQNFRSTTCKTSVTHISRTEAPSVYVPEDETVGETQQTLLVGVPATVFPSTHMDRTEIRYDEDSRSCRLVAAGSDISLDENSTRL